MVYSKPMMGPQGPETKRKLDKQLSSVLLPTGRSSYANEALADNLAASATEPGDSHSNSHKSPRSLADPSDPLLPGDEGGVYALPRSARQNCSRAPGSSLSTATAAGMEADPQNHL